MENNEHLTAKDGTEYTARTLNKFVPLWKIRHCSVKQNP